MAVIEESEERLQPHYCSKVNKKDKERTELMSTSKNKNKVRN